MKNCPNCGEELMENYDTCFACGYEVETLENAKTEYFHMPVQKNTDASFLFVLVAFFFPFIGLILYFLIKENNKNLASMMLTAIFVSVVFYSITVSMMAFLIAI